MIFTKNQTFQPSHYISDSVSFAYNIHIGSTGSLRNLRLQTQDQVIIALYREELERLHELQRTK